MHDHSPQGAAKVAAPPILAMGIPYPAAVFVAALLTDIEYARTADAMWTTMSSWLLLVGLVMATVAVLVELVRVFRDGSRSPRAALVHVLGNGLAVVLSVTNFVFHVRDGYSSVVPVGPVLSAVVVGILLLTGWTSLRLAFRDRSGAREVRS
jgi:uncharacterized membrane protein